MSASAQPQMAQERWRKLSRVSQQSATAITFSGASSRGWGSGVPTIRRIIGKREIDIYPNGLMFEGDHVVGVSKR
jgi:hypothetical protein